MVTKKNLLEDKGDSSQGTSFTLSAGWVQSMYYVNKLFAIFKRHMHRQFGIAVWSHVVLTWKTLHHRSSYVPVTFQWPREAIRARDKQVAPTMLCTASASVRDDPQNRKGSVEWHRSQPSQETAIYVRFMYDLWDVGGHFRP